MWPGHAKVDYITINLREIHILSMKTTKLASLDLNMTESVKAVALIFYLLACMTNGGVINQIMRLMI